ncbi:PREDICTED: phospholipase A1-IIgamma-like [Tarenaya hassleriana]|uniref:phospholipase A1-IIgamma-like n=1 Tax=Tarenaya hassleriana TaxID=28532 RepID=UPI00053C6A33|nr:PREDICTED: phospholipase A1-IIgamma-like [Tarenaya hassleriana]
MGCFGFSRKDKAKQKKKPSSMASTTAKKEPVSKPPAKSASIAQRWRDLSGQSHWNGLLEPLDLDLRQYIVHYGEMVQAAYDTFNSCTESQYAGSSIYSRQDFFSKVGIVNGNPYCKYQVTKFLYATSEARMPGAFMVFPASGQGWTKQSNWIGYVAVATNDGTAVLGRRDIVVAWRGTIETTEWIDDFDFGLVDGSKIFAGKSKPIKVHRGWLSIYTSYDTRSKFNKICARDQLLQEISRLVELYKDEDISITVCGHSLGAALATLSATDIVFNGYNKPKGRPDKACPVTAFPFACPRVGASDFKNLFSGLDNLRALRTKNLPDVVCAYPMVGYSDVGDELAIDTRKSPYLKSPGNVTTFHSMEHYMHGVAGTHGTKGEFRLEINRDISLVNKNTDSLKDEHMVPDHWRVLKNKGMVQQGDGSWKLMDHEPDDGDGQ